MRNPRVTRAGRTLLVSGLVAALAVCLAGPATLASPTDPIGTLDHFGVDQAEKTASITDPGGTASLTTTMVSATVKPVVDVVFVLDTTGSMSGHIAKMAQGLAQFARNVAAAGGSDLAFGIYVFGDVNCGGDVQMWDMPLTALSGGTTVEQVAQKLTSGLRRNGGCDTPEDSVLAGITVAANAPWRTGSQREEIVVTDAPSHIRTSPSFGGQPPNIATWQSIAADKDIHVSIVNAGEGGTDINNTYGGGITLGDMARAFGSDPTIAPKTAEGFTELLTNQVVFGGVAPTYTIVPELSVTYADGAPSTDITATISPSGPTPVSKTPVDFSVTVSAVDMAHIARAGATSTAYVEFTDESSGVIVARQTVRFTAPSEQTVDVVFVDDDNGGAPVTPVAGTKTSYSGLPGLAVGFTEALARAGMPSGYNLVKVDNVDVFPDGGSPARITVHMSHGIDHTTITTTRTVHYTGAGSATPPDAANTITWNVATDNVSKVTTYTATSPAYPAVTSPAVAGYAPDVAVVAALSVTSPVTTAPTSADVTVTYTPTTQVVNVRFVDDDDSGAAVTPVAGFQSRLTGPSGSPVGFTEATARTGIPDGYEFKSLDNVANYDFADGTDQTITVHVVHKMETTSITRTRTIQYEGAGALTPAAVVQSVEWTVTIDFATGDVVYTTASTGYPAVASPVLNGYSPDVTGVAAVSVTSPTRDEPESTLVKVTYSPKQQRVNIRFVDDDDSGAAVTPVTGFVATRTGTGGTAVGFTSADAATGVPAEYVLASVDNVATYDLDDTVDQVITVHLAHDIRVSSIAPARIITYTGAGALTPAAVVQTVNWTVTTDMATGITIYSTTSAGYAEQASPVLNGYTPDQATVPAVPAVTPTREEPRSTAVTVTYSPKPQRAVIRLVDDDAEGAPVEPVTGFATVLTGTGGTPVGFTQTAAEAGIPHGYLFASLENVATYDLDDTADQVITVHLKHEMLITEFTSTRTIHYTGAGAKTPADAVQPITWKVTTDAVTRAATYETDAEGYPALDSPVVAGFSVDRAQVPALAVKSPLAAPPESVTEQVTYVEIIVKTGGWATSPSAGGPWLLLGLAAIAAGVLGTRYARRRA